MKTFGLILMLGVSLGHANDFFMEDIEQEIVNTQKGKVEEVIIDTNKKIQDVPISKLQLDYYIKTIYDQADREQDCIFEKQVSESIMDSDGLEHNLYEERINRISNIFKNLNVNTVKTQIMKAENILENAELITNFDEKVNYIADRINVSTSNKLEQSIFVGKLYFVLALWYSENITDNVNMEKAKKYLRLTNEYDAMIPKIIAIFASDDPTRLLNPSMSSELPRKFINKSFLKIIAKMEENSLASETIKLEYVYGTKAFLTYRKSINELGDSDFATVVDKINKVHGTLRTTNQFFHYIEEGK